MKKYILLMVVFVAALTSCTNDDITISYATNFKINPATVIAPFTEEMTAGELETIPTTKKLRVRLLIYDDKGLLVEEVEQFINTYSTVINTALNLAEGNYVVIAISDVINTDNTENPEYWTLGEHSRLSDTKIVRGTYIGNQYEILGIANQQITIGKGGGEYNINLAPAGAITYTIYYNLDTYTNVNSYELKVTKYSESAIFNANGSFIPTVETNNNAYDWRINTIDSDEWAGSTKNIYAINFILPMQNLYLQFNGEIDDAMYTIGNPMFIREVKAGDEYAFFVDLADSENNYGIECELINGANSYKKNNLQLEEKSGQYKESMILNTQNKRSVDKVKNATLYLKDIK